MKKIKTSQNTFLTTKTYSYLNLSFSRFYQVHLKSGFFYHWPLTGNFYERWYSSSNLQSLARNYDHQLMMMVVFNHECEDPRNGQSASIPSAANQWILQWDLRLCISTVSACNQRLLIPILHLNMFSKLFLNYFWPEKIIKLYFV
jgi:hypothetical protein